jgi:hypothetical protein
MARAETLTKLPLDRWAQIMGLNPMHFNGVFMQTPANQPNVCAQPWLQHSFQSADRVSREDVANAIAQAEGDMEKELNFRLRPSWEVDEWDPTVRPWRPELHNLSNTDLRGFGPVTSVDWGYFVTGGFRAKEVIEAGAAIVFSDNDNDGYSETATITVSVSITNECEVALYYPVGGPVINAGEDKWQIRPIDVFISAGVATITCARHQLVDADRQSDLIPPADDSHLRGVDGAVDANFLGTVDVYRVYNDPQQQVQLLWEPKGCSSCSGTGCAVCSYSVQMGCLLLRGVPRNSNIVYRPAVWNTTDLDFDTAAWSVKREPDLIRVWYYAGWRDRTLACPTLQMDPFYERAVAYYAAALLDRPICECNNIQSWIEQWRKDMASQPSGGGSFQNSPGVLNNQFGTTKGAVFAWNRLDRAIHKSAVFV